MKMNLTPEGKHELPVFITISNIIISNLELYCLITDNHK